MTIDSARKYESTSLSIKENIRQLKALLANRKK
jgi:hypothetical protein